MPKPVFIDHSVYDNNLLQEELNYAREELRGQHDEWITQLTDEQRSVYDAILGSVMSGKGGVFFVYGFGGTGKTFLWNILSAAIRSKGDVVLNVASSGIASLLLPGGRTAHSRFGIPISPDEFSTCNIEPGSNQAELVAKASMIIWDEAPMMSKHCFEALDRTLCDIMKTTDGRPFGGKVVVFGGDFRQILPVIPRGNRADIVMAALNSSYLWKHCKVLQLTKNMRLFSETDPREAEEIKKFSDWILDVGDGKINEPNSGETMIDIPKDLLVMKCTDPIEAIVSEVYGNTFKDSKDPLFFQERAILCPTNEDVDVINNYMLDRLAGNFLDVAHY
ncbi:ATP-dependent DNA helicase PIF2-like [Brassica napus]|uniref:ATP-dependent DNA helicase PIF2-like n=2 Tax=Brassica TaxID=3705 RepID=UPI002078C594|nr:ATP-dependent DNA helicase PIF2-like [Brassica napus]